MFFFLHEGTLATQKTVCFGSKIYTGLKKKKSDTCNRWRGYRMIEDITVGASEVGKSSVSFLHSLRFQYFHKEKGGLFNFWHLKQPVLALPRLWSQLTPTAVCVREVLSFVPSWLRCTEKLISFIVCFCLAHFISVMSG